eukprot:453857_1
MRPIHYTSRIHSIPPTHTLTPLIYTNNASKCVTTNLIEVTTTRTRDAQKEALSSCKRTNSRPRTMPTPNLWMTQTNHDNPRLIRQNDHSCNQQKSHQRTPQMTSINPRSTQ